MDTIFDFDFGVGLGDLFAQSDAVGDRYLSEEEIQDRTDRLQAVWDAIEDLV